MQRRTLRGGEQGGRGSGGPSGHPPGGRARAPERAGTPRGSRTGRDEWRRGSAFAALWRNSRSCPYAEETDFLPGGSGYQDYEQHQAYYWPFYGLEGGVDPGFANASGILTRDTLPPGDVGVRRGERVHATDGEIGKVDGLVVEPTHGHVTHVLLEEGHLWGRKQVAIPISAVARMDEGISVNLTKREIEDLPSVPLSDPGR